MHQLLHPLMRNPEKLARVADAEPHTVDELARRNTGQCLSFARFVFEALSRSASALQRALCCHRRRRASLIVRP